MDITLQDIDKLSLLKRVQEHEKNGFECICRITPKRTVCQDYAFYESRKRRFKQKGLTQFTMYYVKMRKPE